jgi:hypothetical protein
MKPTTPAAALLAHVVECSRSATCTTCERLETEAERARAVFSNDFSDEPTPAIPYKPDATLFMERMAALKADPQP